MQNVMIGSDPEMFVKNMHGVYHAIGLVGGSKESPLKIDRGALQEDNVLLEFNIDPTDDESVFLENIRSVMHEAKNRMNFFGMDLVPNMSSYVYESLSGFPDSAFIFGCDPDYNALTGDKNPEPSAANPNLRTAGGHIHIGWGHSTPVTLEDQKAVGVMCDYFLGLESLLKDPDDGRRELYGKASAVRFKPYGVEYRTLSNFWIWDDANILWAFRQAQKAYTAAMSYGTLLRSVVAPEDVQTAINSNDRVLAQALLEAIRNAEQY